MKHPLRPLTAALRATFRTASRRQLAALALATSLLAACASQPQEPQAPAVPSAPAAPAAPTAPEAPAPPAAAPAAPAAPLPRTDSMNEIAAAYVRLVLALGERDPGYVDAYYGPPEWRVQAQNAALSNADIFAAAQALELALKSAPPDKDAPQLGEWRRSYLRNQIGALAARARMLDGLKLSFDEESRALFDTEAPQFTEAELDTARQRLDALLPRKSPHASHPAGKPVHAGKHRHAQPPAPAPTANAPAASAAADDLGARYNAYIERFTVPAAKVEAAMQLAIKAARQRTLAHMALPPGESFELKRVKQQPWSAYNWYQGHYSSRIEVNTDLPITVDRIVVLASHEGYPGHHVYNSLLEQQLVNGHGWVEFTVYPLFSPQSFIAEGSADYGVDLAFPPAERLKLDRELFKLIGANPAEAEHYEQVRTAAAALGPAALEAARRYVDGQLDDAAALAWLQKYALASPERAKQRLDFIRKYRSYIINYSYGEALVRNYVETHAGASESARWKVFTELLSTPHTPGDLLQ